MVPDPHNLPRLGAACLVVDQIDGKILMVRRGKDPMRGKWTLPGGGIHPFEKWADAMKREVLEETGVQIHLFDEQRPLIFEIINEPDEHRLIIVGQAMPVGYRACKVTPGDDADEVEWVATEYIRPNAALRRPGKVYDLSPATSEILIQIGVFIRE